MPKPLPARGSPFVCGRQTVKSTAPVARAGRPSGNLGGMGPGFPSAFGHQKRISPMSDWDISNFVIRFAAAWSTRDGQAFLDMWEPDGLLHSPLYDRPIKG